MGFSGGFGVKGGGGGDEDGERDRDGIVWDRDEMVGLGIGNWVGNGVLRGRKIIGYDVMLIGANIKVEQGRER